MGKPFVINRHGRLVFPSNFLADFDFTAIETEEQLSAVVRRDFEAKAPTGVDIMAKATSGGYWSRFHLLRDLALNLFWANRYAMTMYDKRPTRWRDVPRSARRRLPADPRAVEGRRAQGRRRRRLLSDAPRRRGTRRPRTGSIGVLFDVYRHKLHHATELSAIKPTVPEACWPPDDSPHLLPVVLRPRLPGLRLRARSSTAREEHPELEALQRMAMVCTTSTRGTARRSG